MSGPRPRWRDWRVPLVLAAGLVLLSLALPRLEPLFAALFPALERPMYRQESFAGLLLSHLRLVLVSSGAALAVALPAGVWVTRPAGRDYRSLVASLVAMGQTFPPVVVLALAGPLIGFGEQPAYVALALYGLLPMLQGVIAGLDATPAAARDAACGLGMSAAQTFWSVELPLAAPVVLAGIRTSVTINIGTATIAATVGAQNLGSPIIIGLSSFNVAYVLQGALLTGWLAITADALFEGLARHTRRWREQRSV